MSVQGKGVKSAAFYKFPGDLKKKPISMFGVACNFISEEGLRRVVLGQETVPGNENISHSHRTLSPACADARWKLLVLFPERQLLFKSQSEPLPKL